jgi:hypothetical protein
MLGLKWNKSERLDVSWPQDAEVPVIEGGQLRLAEPLDDREHRGIDEPDVRIGVAIAQFTNSRIVISGESFDPVGAGDDVVKQCGQYSGVQPGMNPVVHLDEDWSGNDQRFLGRLDEPAAGGVVGIAPIQRGVDRCPGSAPRTRLRALLRCAPCLSAWPDAPTPRLRGCGRCWPTASSTALRISSAMEIPRSAATVRRRLRRFSGSEIVVRSIAS